jgi:hypothetical protein
MQHAAENVSHYETNLNWMTARPGALKIVKM